MLFTPALDWITLPHPRTLNPIFGRAIRCDCHCLLNTTGWGTISKLLTLRSNDRMHSPHPTAQLPALAAPLSGDHLRLRSSSVPNAVSLKTMRPRLWITGSEYHSVSMRWSKAAGFLRAYHGQFRHPLTSILAREGSGLLWT